MAASTQPPNHPAAIPTAPPTTRVPTAEKIAPQQRDPGAEDQLAQHVLADVVGTEQVGRAGRLKDSTRECLGPVGGEEATEGGDQSERPNRQPTGRRRHLRGTGQAGAPPDDNIGGGDRRCHWRILGSTRP